MPMSTTANERVLALPKDRLIALSWSTPFLVFLAFPIATCIEAGWSHPVVPLLFAATVALALTYIASWLINPSAPRSPRITARFVVCFLLVVASQAAMESTVAMAASDEASGGAYMVCYIASIAALQSPKPLMVPLSAFSLALAGVEVAAVPHEPPIAVLTVGMSLTVCLMARFSMERDRRARIEHQQELLLEREQERSRISADLHDILGQTLTGITIKADLAGRLLDAGSADEARAQIAELTDLSRSALADVRAVVVQNRTLLPQTEIEQSRDLVEAAGIRFDVIRRGDPAPGQPSTLVAHAIREGVTNALRHASPTVVTVTLRSDGVRVANNGLSRRQVAGAGSSPASVLTGSGLAGLRERVGEAGTVTFGVDGRRWVLDVVLTVEA